MIFMFFMNDDDFPDENLPDSFLILTIWNPIPIYLNFTSTRRR